MFKLNEKNFDQYRRLIRKMIVKLELDLVKLSSHKLDHPLISSFYCIDTDSGDFKSESHIRWFGFSVWSLPDYTFDVINFDDSDIWVIEIQDANGVSKIITGAALANIAESPRSKFKDKIIFNEIFVWCLLLMIFNQIKTDAQGNKQINLNHLLPNSVKLFIKWCNKMDSKYENLMNDFENNAYMMFENSLLDIPECYTSINTNDFQDRDDIDLVEFARAYLKIYNHRQKQNAIKAKEIRREKDIMLNIFMKNLFKSRDELFY